MDFNAKLESEMFDQAAEYYDKFRPGYPEEIVEAFVKGAKLDQTSKVLEIGAGSGKATAYFKDYGFSIRCVEVGENLVKNGRIKFREYDRIQFECGRFEELPDTEETYDAIFAAQAFHWIPQPIGYQKCARMLKEGGYLAPFWNMYLIEDREEDQALRRLSDQYGGFADFVDREEAERRIASISQEMQDSGYFGRPEVIRKRWVKEYTAEEYYGFVLTGNRFLQLPEKVKQEARTEIMALAETYGGKIVRPYLCVLYLSQAQI